MHTKAGPLSIYYLSEQAVTIEFGDRINDEVHNQVSRFNQMIRQQAFPGFTTTVAAYATLTVFYDTVTVIRSGLPGAGCFEKVSNYLNDLAQLKSKAGVATGDTITIPVHYGGEFGPDIADVARHSQLSINEAIDLHSSATYQVYMIGFVPGFAYLGGMDSRLATPRKAMPRKAVPAGAVGIAGQQTGVYPLQTPGGWQIIGQTPVKLFDANRAQPSLLKAGDSVVFKSITQQEFNHLSGK